MSIQNSYPTQETDGYGERIDIARAREKDILQITENKDSQRFQIIERVQRSSDFGTATNAKPLSSVVQEMLEQERYCQLFYKSEIQWDVESISEALNEACIKLGLDEEEFAPAWNDLGDQVEITLI